MGISKANQQTAQAKDELRQSADSSLRAVSPIAAKTRKPWFTPRLFVLKLLSAWLNALFYSFISTDGKT